MRITVTHDDGTSSDVTDLVTHAYECLWEGTRWHKDWQSDEVEKFAALAEAIRHSSAPVARETVEQVHLEKAEAKAAEEAWYRERGVTASLWKTA